LKNGKKRFVQNSSLFYDKSLLFIFEKETAKIWMNKTVSCKATADGFAGKFYESNLAVSEQ